MDKTTEGAVGQQGSIFKRIGRKIRRSNTCETIMRYGTYYRWVSQGRPANVPSPHIQKRRQIKEFSSKYKIATLVETGTYMGDMVYAMRNQFSEIYSIEFSQVLYERAKLRFANQKNVHLLQGDSALRMQEVVQSVKGPAIFWLDAHYSGGITGRADLETPIVKEIEFILSRPENHVLIIDDARCFNGTHDYPVVEAIRAQIQSLKPAYAVYVKYDAIIAEPRAT